MVKRLKKTCLRLMVLITELAERLEVPRLTFKEVIANYRRKGIVFELMEY